MVSLGKKVSINKKRIIDYLLFSCGKKDETFFEEIHKLPKASFLSYKDSNLEIKEYYKWGGGLFVVGDQLRVLCKVG